MPGDLLGEVTDPSALRVFINYRRGPATPYARQLYEKLSARFGVDNVFWDVDTIQPGMDFVDFIRQAVGLCQVMVSVIGPGWLEASDPDGRRRLENPEDFVRLEIEAALDRKIRIIPVLVGDGTVPRSTDLPSTLAPFVRRNAVEISDSRWDYDTGRLLRVLDRVEAEERAKLAEAEAAQQTEEERARAAAEAQAEAERRAEQERARAAEAERLAEEERRAAEAAEQAKAAAEAEAAERAAQERARVAAEAEAARLAEQERVRLAAAAEAEAEAARLAEQDRQRRAAEAERQAERNAPGPPKPNGLLRANVNERLPRRSGSGRRRRKRRRSFHP